MTHAISIILFVAAAFASKPEPSAFEKSLGGWKDSKLKVCHYLQQKYFVSTAEQEDTCRGRGGYVAFATPEERTRVTSSDSGVPTENDAIYEHTVRKTLPAPSQRNYDPLGN